MAGENSIETGIGMGEAQILPNVQSTDYSSVTNAYMQRQQRSANEKAAAEKQKQDKIKNFPEIKISGVMPQHVPVANKRAKDLYNAYFEAVQNGDTETQSRIEQEEIPNLLGFIEDSKTASPFLKSIYDDIGKNPDKYDPEYVENLKKTISGDGIDIDGDLVDLMMKSEEVIYNPLFAIQPVEYKKDYEGLISAVDAEVRSKVEQGDKTITVKGAINDRETKEAVNAIVQGLTPAQKAQMVYDDGIISKEAYKNIMSESENPDVQRQYLDLYLSSSGDGNYGNIDDYITKKTFDRVKAKYGKEYEETYDEGNKGSSGKSDKLGDVTLEQNYTIAPDELKGKGIRNGNRYVFGKPGGNINPVQRFKSPNNEIEDPLSGKKVNEIEANPVSIIEDVVNNKKLLEVNVTGKDIEGNKITKTLYLPYEANSELIENEYGGFEDIKKKTQGKYDVLGVPESSNKGSLDNL